MFKQLPRDPANVLHENTCVIPIFEQQKEEDTSGEDKKPGDTVVEDKPAEKPDEEGLTFNEWAQKVLAEEEKEKHHGEILLNNVYTPSPPHPTPSPRRKGSLSMSLP